MRLRVVFGLPFFLRVKLPLAGAWREEAAAPFPQKLVFSGNARTISGTKKA
jgi:hypothetical protein